jgi:hypothetical protein
MQKRRLPGLQRSIRDAIEQKRQINVKIRNARAADREYRKKLKFIPRDSESRLQELFQQKDDIDRRMHEYRKEILEARIWIRM